MHIDLQSDGATIGHETNLVILYRLQQTHTVGCRRILRVELPGVVRALPMPPETGDYIGRTTVAWIWWL